MALCVKESSPARLLRWPSLLLLALVAALAPSISWPNLARAHSVAGAALTSADGDRGNDSADAHAGVQPLGDITTRSPWPIQREPDHHLEATPDGDGTVAYQNTDGDDAYGRRHGRSTAQQRGPPRGGRQARQCGGDSLTTHGEVMEETIRRVGDPRGAGGYRTRIVLMALYDSTERRQGWTIQRPTGGAL